MFLASGKTIAARIQALVDDEVTPPVKLAVAFWGAGADFTLRGACLIVCDLVSGACNPAVIRALQQRDNCVVRKYDGLHAKVVIGSTGAVVSSANMSTNGLGAEGADASGTIEAGYFVAPTAAGYHDIVAWFDGVWSAATAITEGDFAAAQEQWIFRNREMLATSTTPTSPPATAVNINPLSLLEPDIASAHVLRAVRKDVFAHLQAALPGISSGQLGKIAMWACHLIVNRTGSVLRYEMKHGQNSGLATDAWIVARFVKKTKSAAAGNVAAVLEAIGRDPFFTADIRRAAHEVLAAAPWEHQGMSRTG
jgi:hypothetical protein